MERFQDSDGRWWTFDGRGGVKPCKAPPELVRWRRLPENKKIPHLLYQGLREEIL
ncbi:MAG: hypothetical protein ACYDHY_06805 [Acidiferrobacterales bacterium]